MRLNYLTIQYLEPTAILPDLDVSSVVRRLQDAAEKIPISHVLIGWHLPQPLLEACRLEAERLGMRFLRWQPLLTTDQDVTPNPSWQTLSLDGQRVLGHRGLPEFTFFCPNHPGVKEALTLHLENLINQGIYQGFFLDRARYPSPCVHPLHYLACFCEYCHRSAAKAGLDLQEIRQALLQQIQSESGRLAMIKTLLTGRLDPDDPDTSQALSQFMTFRTNTLSDFFAQVSQSLRHACLEVGLDCFSPCLAPMVGQDIRVLSTRVDWVKLMTYAHTLAPAGLPYELLGLMRYITKSTSLDEVHALDLIRQSTSLPLSDSFQALEQDGLSPLALEMELKRGIESSSAHVLAGIELVDLPGITRLNTNQILADLSAVIQARPDGLAISWDLWHIPLERLDLVRQVY